MRASSKTIPLQQSATQRLYVAEISGLGCLAAPLPASDYLDPDDLHVVFSEIHQPLC